MRRLNTCSRSFFAAGLRTLACLMKSSSIRRSSFSSISISACRFFEKAASDSFAFFPALESLRTRAGSNKPIFPSTLVPVAQPASETAHATNTNAHVTRYDTPSSMSIILEQRSDRELEDTFPFSRKRIEIDPVSRTQGAERRDPAPFQPGRLA